MTVKLPALPDDDSDFTPDLARKVIAKYIELSRLEAIEECAKVAEGTGAAMFSEAETAAVDALRTDIVAAIRALKGEHNGNQ